MPRAPSASAVASMARSSLWPPAPGAQTKTAVLMALTSSPGTRGPRKKNYVLSTESGSVALELRVARLPEEEGVVVGGLALALLFRRADAVAGVVVEVEEHGLAGGGGGDEARRHLHRLPVVDARVVDAVHQHHRGIGDAFLHVVVAAHREERAELVLLRHGAVLGAARHAVGCGLGPQPAEDTDPPLHCARV